MEFGLSHVTLLNLEVRTCAACGDREFVIPAIEELHRVIAQTLATSPARLGPERVRYLRTWRDRSSADVAAMMGVRPETVSRWESRARAIKRRPTAERLLRLIVANGDPGTKCPVSYFSRSRP